MKRLTGAAKRAHARKVLQDEKRNKDIAQKRQAITRMQASHIIVKRMQKFDAIAYNSKRIVEIAFNASKIALYSSPCIVLVALTVKALLFISNL